MGKKTVQDVVKGVVITGTAIGGASVFSDMGLAYAQETPQEGEELVVPTAEEQPQANNTNEENQPASGEGDTVVNTTGDTTGDTTVETPGEAESFADTAETASTLTDEQLSESAATSLSQEESELASTSESQSESLEGTIDSLTIDINDTQTTYESESQVFVDNGYVDVTEEAIQTRLDAVETKIDGQAKAEEELRDYAVDNNIKTIGKVNYYKEVGRPLCLSMIEHKMLLEGMITPEYTFKETMDLSIDQKVVSYKFYEDKGYESHHYCIKFVDANGKYQELYFDYVTCDADGNSMIKPAGSTAYGPDENPELAKGINVLIKSPKYSEILKRTYKINGETVKVYNRDGFYTDETGSMKGVDWYTMGQYNENVGIRQDIYNLPSEVQNLKDELSNVESSASASMVASQSAREERLASLEASASASTSASEYKSESLRASENLATSLLQSSSSSLSMSLSETASSAAVTSETAVESILGTQVEEDEEVAIVTDEQIIKTQATTNASASNVTANIVTNFTADNAGNVAPAAMAPDQIAPEIAITPIIANEQVPLAVVDDAVVEADQEFMTENDLNTVTTIEDTEVAKAAASANVAKWTATTLPVIGTLTAIFSKKKSRDDKQ